MSWVSPDISRKVLEWQIAAKHAGVFGENIDATSTMDMEMIVGIVDNAEREDLMDGISRDHALVMVGIILGRFYQSYLTRDSHWKGMEKSRKETRKMMGE